MPKSSPAKADTLGELTEFTYDGVAYKVAPASEWDLDVLESYEDGRIIAAVRALLGEAQWKKFRSKPRKTSDLNDLFGAIQEAVGVSGN